jgi:hypothetical protein
VRILGAFLSAFVVVAACEGDTGGGGASSDTAVPPSACMTPCTPGSDPCLVAPEDACSSGAWYCWSDAKWHCAPPDASAPGEGGYDAAEIEASLQGEGTGDSGSEASAPAADAGAD